MVHLSVDKVVEGLPAFEEEECEARGGASLRRLYQRVARDINDVRVDGAFGFEGPRMGHHLFPKAELIHSFKEFRELKRHNVVYYSIIYGGMQGARNSEIPPCGRTEKVL